MNRVNQRPRRRDTWTCPVPTCGTVNEPDRRTCISANDPAKHPPPPQPEPKPETTLFEVPATGHRVRQILDGNGEPWFSAADTDRAFDLGGVRKCLMVLDAPQRGVRTVEGKPMTVVSESGLYTLILRSRTPAAAAFRRWVTAKALPAVRRTSVCDGAPVPEPAARHLKALDADTGPAPGGRLTLVGGA